MIKELTLYEMDLSELKPILRNRPELKDLDIFPSICFWLGSVDMKDESRLRTFLSLVNAGDIDKLRTYSDTGNDLVYSVLIKGGNGDKYHLVTIQLNEGLSLPVIVSIDAVSGIRVSGVKGKEVELDYLPKSIFVEIIKNIFK